MSNKIHRFLRTQGFQKAIRDRTNRLFYGANAPVSDECIFVDPRDISHRYMPDRQTGARNFRRADSGLILAGDWDRSVASIEGEPKRTACFRHFRDGVPWGETGIYEYMLKRIERFGSFDGVRTLEAIEARYRRMDKVYEEIRRDQRMKTRAELPAYFRREYGGILVHIDRDGRPLKGRGANHRLAMVHVLGLRRIPAQIGVVHRDAVRNGILDGLRSEN